MVSKKKLTEFLLYLENQSNADFSKWLTGINIFEVLGISSTEIRHSRMLSWLLNPKENHQLRDKFLKKFLLSVLEKNNHISAIQATDVILKDFSDSMVFRESKSNIDIFLTSEYHKFNLVIENKTFTQDHDNQLEKYRKYVETEYKGYKNLFVYLTPSGVVPSEASEEEKEFWKLLSYQEVSDILQELVEDSTVDDKVCYILKEYNDNIRRNILNDRELKELSSEIYFKYKEVLDLIINNRPDVAELRDKLVEALVKLTKDEKLIFKDSYSSKKILRFRTEKFDKFFDQRFDDSKKEWSTGSVYFYEITYYNFQVNIYLSIYSKPRIEHNQDVLDKINFITKNKYNSYGFNVRNTFLNLDLSEQNILDVTIVDMIVQFIEENLQQITDFEEDIISKWNEQIKGETYV